MYYTNVIKNDELFMLAENTDKFKKRDCFLLLHHFFSESYDGKVLIIYGLPKTGKTTLMLQKIKMLPKERVVYIKITEADNMKVLCKDLDKLKNEGYNINTGFDIVYYGTIPNGAGLSSSASIEVLTGFVLKQPSILDELPAMSLQQHLLKKKLSTMINLRRLQYRKRVEDYRNGRI